MKKEAAVETKEACQDKPTENILFTRKTCPNCKTSKILLDKAGIKYVSIDAEEQKDITLKYGVTNAPTLLVPAGNGYEVYDNVSKIKKFVEDNKN